MPAAPQRTVLARIPDVEDREVHVSLVTWSDNPEWTQIEIADYIVSTKTYGRGYLFDAKLLPKVMGGMRGAKSAGLELTAQAAAREIAS